MEYANIITSADSYKLSHYAMYPPGITEVSNYIEAREGGLWKFTSFFGLQAFLMNTLEVPIIEDEIDEAERLAALHGVPFNRTGWEHIIDEHDGFMPIRIEAVPEGLEVPTGNVLVQYENTDPECWWLPSYLETGLLQGVWYPTTVATNSKVCKYIIQKYLAETGCEYIPETIGFSLHDFGYRGAATRSAAALGGAAHLTNFLGTDTLAALELIDECYTEGLPDDYIAGFSIPASEHSTIVSWGIDNEEAAYRNVLDQFLKPESVVACVSDSFDIMKACDMWGTTFKQQIMDSEGRLVVRPDSGDPIQMSLAVIERLGKYFEPEVNKAGYKVLPECIRVIYGDGINDVSIAGILQNLKSHGWAAENINFGMGGALLQGVNRDTLRFACKTSQVIIDGEVRDVFKSPVNSDFKGSKPGRLALVRNQAGELVTIKERDLGDRENILQPVFENGDILKIYNLEEVRELAAIEIET